MTTETPPAGRSRGAALVSLAIPLLACAWLFLTSLSEPHSGLSVWDGKRVLELGLFPLLILVALLNARLRWAFKQALGGVSKPVAMGLGLFFLLGVVSALRLDHPGYALAEVSLLALLIVSVLLIAASRILLGTAFERTVLAALAITGFGVFMLELVAFSAYLGTEIQYSYVESLIRFGHPRMYNQVQTWTIPLLALLPLVFPDKPWVGRLAPVLIGLQWHIIVLTGARGTTTSLICAMVLIALLAPRLSRFWLRQQVVGLILGLLIYAGFSAFLTVAEPEDDSFVQQSVGRTMTTSGRSYLWELAMQDVQASPLLGAGPAMYACDSPWPIASSPHNFPLQVLSEWGVPAFTLLAFLVVWLLFGLIARVRALNVPGDGTRTDTQNCVFACLAGSVMAAAIHAQFSGILIAPASHVTGMLVLGWLWGQQPHNDIRGNGWLPVGVLVAALVVSLMLGNFARTEQKVLEFRTSYAQDYRVASPRFWRDGRVCLYSWDSSENE